MINQWQDCLWVTRAKEPLHSLIQISQIKAPFISFLSVKLSSFWEYFFSGFFIFPLLLASWDQEEQAEKSPTFFWLPFHHLFLHSAIICWTAASLGAWVRCWEYNCEQNRETVTWKLFCNHFNSLDKSTSFEAYTVYKNTTLSCWYHSLNYPFVENLDRKSVV